MQTNNNPEDAYLEKLREKSIRDTIDELLGFNITDNLEYQVLFQWCIEGKAQAEIAKELGTYQMKISRIIKNIQKKCFRYIRKHIVYGSDIKELFDSLLYRAIMSRPKRNHKEIGSAKHKIAYPSEYLQKVSIRPLQTRKNGVIAYTPQTVCRVPEYFREAFSDDLTCCPICCNDIGENKCMRKEESNVNSL